MTYAVVWSPNDDGAAAGRLELACTALRLAGRPGYELPYDEIAAMRIERSPMLRLAGRPTLVVETRHGETLRIASLDGAGTLHEVEERLQSKRSS